MVGARSSSRSAAVSYQEDRFHSQAGRSSNILVDVIADEDGAFGGNAELIESHLEDPPMRLHVGHVRGINPDRKVIQ